MKWWCTSLFLFLFLGAGSQNLIPDEFFESTTAPECFSPVFAMDYAVHWYSASGTPDHFIAGCEGQASGWAYWERHFLNNNFVGISGTHHVDGYRSTEVVATRLMEPMEPDRFYYFQINVRNRGVWHSEDLVYCETDPPKRIDVSVSPEPITFYIDPLTQSAEITGEKVLSITSDHIQDSLVVDEWQTYHGCIEGIAGAEHLGIHCPTGAFTASPPCFIDPLSFFLFHYYYYDIDDVVLLPYPKPQTVALILCEEEPQVSFDAATLFSDSRALEGVEFIWKDGSKGKNRSFKEAGEYEVIMELDCSQIPVQVVVEEENCLPRVYVPNVFSPNFDGINDYLRPFLQSPFPLTDLNFVIYDRWGNLCYQVDALDESPGWDGMVNGIPAPKGVFVWMLNFSILENGALIPYTLSGDFLMLP